MWCVPNHRNVQDVRIQCHADELMCMIWCTMSHTFEHSGHQQVNCCMHHVLTNIGRPLLPCCWGYSLGLFKLFGFQIKTQTQKQNPKVACRNKIEFLCKKLSTYFQLHNRHTRTHTIYYKTEKHIHTHTLKYIYVYWWVRGPLCLWAASTGPELYINFSELCIKWSRTI